MTLQINRKWFGGNWAIGIPSWHRPWIEKLSGTLGVGTLWMLETTRKAALHITMSSELGVGVLHWLVQMHYPHKNTYSHAMDWTGNVSTLGNTICAKLSELFYSNFKGSSLGRSLTLMKFSSPVKLKKARHILSLIINLLWQIKLHIKLLILSKLYDQEWVSCLPLLDWWIHTDLQCGQDSSSTLHLGTSIALIKLSHHSTS